MMVSEIERQCHPANRRAEILAEARLARSGRRCRHRG